LEVRSRWGAFLAALGATAVLAVGFGIAVTRATAAAAPAPRLHSVAAGTLSQMGISLAAADQPPYCGAERVALGQGWIATGRGGCAIDSSDAIDSAVHGDPGTAQEAVLARVSVTGAGPSAVGGNRLAWVVVVHSALFVLPASGCGPPVATGPACASRRLGPVSNQAVVVVDGETGQVLATVPVVGQTSPNAAG
jgi:hypothetical protein